MKYFKLITISCLLVLTSCQSILEDFVVLHCDNDNSISLQPVSSFSSEDAIQQALAFVNEMDFPTRSTELNKQVSSVYAWRSNEIYPSAITRSGVSPILPDTLFYIVNFGENEGYALVSASKRHPGVMAYIEKGRLTPNDDIENPGFRLFLDGYREYIQIDSVIGPSGPFEPVTPHLYQVEYNAGPLLTTNWGQGTPYNNNCPVINNTHAPSGCVAIAVAQIAGYHRFPEQSFYYETPYNWNSFMQYEGVPASDSIASANVAMLVHDIGMLVNMNYGENSSGTYYENVEDALQSYGYNYLIDHSAIFDSIKVDIDNERPVYMQGARQSTNNGETIYYGHAWVVDGVAIKSLYLERNHGGGSSIVKLTQNLIHCNWGWNGSNNGYFIIGAFQNRYNLDNDGIETGFRPYNYYNYVYRKITPILYN